MFRAPRSRILTGVRHLYREDGLKKSPWLRIQQMSEDKQDDGTPGSGAGKGGGGGGSIRSAGGSLGKMAASQEESYFHKCWLGACQNHDIEEVIVRSVEIITATDCPNFVMNMIMKLPTAAAGH